MSNVVPPSESASASHPEVCEPAGCPRFLCVDDNDFVRNAIRTSLIKNGWDCINARDGEEALQQLNAGQEPFDFLITDHQMPGMGGLELVRRVRAIGFTGRILVCSTTLPAMDQAAYQELNVDAIISKTGGLKQLLQAIAGLNQPRSFHAELAAQEV
jgi:two-component system, OmpR family, KDP operon response regulator KdpE